MVHFLLNKFIHNLGAELLFLACTGGLFKHPCKGFRGSGHWWLQVTSLALAGISQLYQVINYYLTNLGGDWGPDYIRTYTGARMYIRKTDGKINITSPSNNERKKYVDKCLNNDKQ